jgi:hypothetical protein
MLEAARNPSKSVCFTYKPAIYGSILIVLFFFQVESVIEFEPGLETFNDHLMEMKSAQARVYIMYAGYVK